MKVFCWCSLKKKWNFHWGVQKELVEFPWVLVFDLRISKVCQTSILQSFQGWKQGPTIGVCMPHMYVSLILLAKTWICTYKYIDMYPNFFPIIFLKVFFSLGKTRFVTVYICFKETFFNFSYKLLNKYFFLPQSTCQFTCHLFPLSVSEAGCFECNLFWMGQ